MDMEVSYEKGANSNFNKQSGNNIVLAHAKNWSYQN